MYKPVAISSERLPTAAAEKFKYSFGVRVGDLVWISGQVALKEGQIVGVDDIRAQAEQVFGNLRTVHSHNRRRLGPWACWMRHPPYWLRANTLHKTGAASSSAFCSYSHSLASL